MKKLAIIITHPIQYYTPFFKLLHERKKIAIKVFYTWGTDALGHKYDPGFGKMVEWDIPLLSGYEYEFIENTSIDQGSHHFKGIINPALVKKINEYDPDALLVYGWSFRSHLKVLRHFKNKIPVYFRGDSTLLDESPNFSLKKFFRRFFLKWVYSYVDIAFYPGTRSKDYFIVHGLKEMQLVFAPHAVDNNKFSYSDKIEMDVLRWKKELGINENNIVFLFAGKFQQKKGSVNLINAFKRIEDKHSHLVFVGNGILEKEMKDLANGNSNIHFLPFQNQSKMPVVYHLCDVFVLPSIGPAETWGLAVNEAMSAGKAILASDKVGCAVDLVKDKMNGYIFKAGDENDLLNKIDLLNVDKSRLREMGLNSLNEIRNWNLLSFATAIEEVLNSNN